MSDLNPDIIEQAALAAHRRICEDSWEDCLEWDGKCVRAVEEAAPLIAAKALESAADDLDLEDAAKASDLNDLDFDWSGRYWEAVAEDALRRRAAKLREAA